MGGFSLILSARADVVVDGSVINVGDGPTVVAEGMGWRIAAFPMANVSQEQDVLHLHNGSVLCLGEGECVVRAGAADVRSLAGAIHVSLHGNQLTVAAVSSPAVVRIGSALTVVPAGWQWRFTGDALPRAEAGVATWLAARTIQPLPARFLREQLQRMDVLGASSSEEFLPAPGALPAPLKRQDYLLPDAFARRQESWNFDVLGALRQRTEARDFAGLQVLFDDPTYAEALKSRAARAMIAVLLSSPDLGLTAQPLLSHYVHADDARLLASLHPVLHAVALTFPARLDASEDALLALLLVLPQADRSPQPLAAFAVERWERNARSALKAREEPADLLAALVRTLSQHAEDLEQVGYPERARRWADALHRLVAGYETMLSDADQDRLDQLAAFRRVTLQAAPDSMIDETAVLPATPSLSAAELTARTEQALGDAGALFTVATEIEALDGSAVHVSSILFAGSQGDLEYSFVFDVPTRTVHSIVRGSQEFPYGLEWDAFVAWVSK